MRHHFSRCQMLQTIAGGISATAIATRLHTTQGSETPRGLPGAAGARLAIATICTDGFGNQHHEPAIRHIPAMGFKNV